MTKNHLSELQIGTIRAAINYLAYQPANRSADQASKCAAIGRLAEKALNGCEDSASDIRDTLPRAWHDWTINY